MNKKYTTLLLIPVLVALLLVALVIATQPWRKIAPPAAPTPTPTPVYAATIEIKAEKEQVSVGQQVPITLAFRLDKDPSNRGIVGIKTVLKITPGDILTLDAKAKDAIIKLLPSPWQLLRQEITPSGELSMEFIYFQIKETGFISNQKVNIAKLNFIAQKPGSVNLSIDTKQSRIRAKQENWYVPVTAEPESINISVIP